jgi:putative DNA primase/helicase
VLAWAVQGYADYCAQGLADPKAVTERTESYRVSSDSLGRFLAECTVQKERVKLRARELFDKWQKWCSDNGEAPGSEVEFADSMATRGQPKRKSHGVMIYDGLGLLADSSEPDWAQRAAGDDGD